MWTRRSPGGYMARDHHPKKDPSRGGRSHEDAVPSMRRRMLDSRPSNLGVVPALEAAYVP